MLTEEELNLHELALLLHMPVYKILEEMPYDEFRRWCQYFVERPFGWREDRRTLLLMSAFGAKVDIANTFPSLALRQNHVTETPVLKGTKMLSFMNGAVGGIKLKE